MLQAVLEIQHFIHIQYTSVKLLSVAGHSDFYPPPRQNRLTSAQFERQLLLQANMWLLQK